MSLEVAVITNVAATVVSLAPPPFGQIGSGVFNILGALLSEFTAEKPLRFEDIEPKLQAMISSSIDKKELKDLENDLQGIRRRLEDYKGNVDEAKEEAANGVPIDYKELSNQLNQINQTLTGSMDKFFNPSGSRAKTFPLFGLAAAMHLSVLEELTLYGNNSVNELAQLRRRAKTYTDVANQTMSELIGARQNQIGDVQTLLLGIIPGFPNVLVRFNIFFIDKAIQGDRNRIFNQIVDDIFGPQDEGARGDVLGPNAFNAQQQAFTAQANQINFVGNEFRNGFNQHVQPILDAWGPILNPPKTIGNDKSTTVWVQNFSNHHLVLDSSVNESNGEFETQPEVPVGEIMGKYVSKPATFGLVGVRFGSKGTLTWKVKNASEQEVGTIRLDFNCSKFAVDVAEAKLEVTRAGFTNLVTLQGRVGSKYRDWVTATKSGNVSKVEFKPEGLGNASNAGHPLSLRLIIGEK